MANDFARVEIDETPLDILVLNNDGTVMRPRISVSIDPYTRMVVGFHLLSVSEHTLPQEIEP